MAFTCTMRGPFGPKNHRRIGAPEQRETTIAIHRLRSGGAFLWSITYDLPLGSSRGVITTEILIIASNFSPDRQRFGAFLMRKERTGHCPRTETTSATQSAARPGVCSRRTLPRVTGGPCG